jgi:membrane-bound serine protease (ClpP class)
VNACSARLHVRLGAVVTGLVGLALVALLALMPPTAVPAAPTPPASQASTPGAQPNVGSAGVATVLEINGAIGPATSRYVTKALDAARANHSRLVILRIDTPGGLDTAMREIIRAILASPVPVVSYVSPPGARAASAGTYILYASHIAAMAPATNLGAATPVSIGGGDEPAPPPNGPMPNRTPQDADQAKQDGDHAKHGNGQQDADHAKHGDSKQDTAHAKQDEGSQDTDHAKHDEGSQENHAPVSAMERKVVNDAVAYIRGLAELRARNADWAEQAVRGAASLSASEALKQGVIDVIARDIPDLLSQIDGREIHVVGNNVVKLATRNLVVENVKPDWRVELLSVITNPTVAYGLLLIGIYGLLFEGYNPGAVFPGVIGAISLLIALFAFQVLSVNYAGLALVVVGVGMIIAEFFFPTFGSLGLGGLIAFVVGSLILFDSDIPGMNIGLPVIAGLATVGGLVIVAMAWLASRSLRRPVVTGVQAMIGERAEVVEGFSDRGRIRYGGELWNARSHATLQAGQTVRITQVDGLTLWVEPV